MSFSGFSLIQPEGFSQKVQPEGLTRESRPPPLPWIPAEAGMTI
jgi:hypothetical protein